MCGIVGYIGNEQAAPILLDGLSKLEYRGYDSAGIAVRDSDGNINIVKAKGRLKGLIEKTDSGNAVPGTCGIGHTRWATHGEPSETNAHPHMSDDGNVVGVHNGIIENYQELKEKLLKKGYSFYSSTDTEVAITTELQENTIVITFENFGNPIAEEKLKLIFEQFYRVDTSRNTTSGGAGLGLAIAKHIVELHKGTIVAHSKDECIKFIVTLPLS